MMTPDREMHHGIINAFVLSAPCFFFFSFFFRNAPFRFTYTPAITPQRLFSRSSLAHTLSPFLVRFFVLISGKSFHGKHFFLDVFSVRNGLARFAVSFNTMCPGDEYICFL